VPIFIRLKNYAKSAKDENDFKLFNSIHRELYSCGIFDKKVTETILIQGRGLILLDGLDEVPAEDELEVVEKIRQFSDYFYKNKVVITCRIAASQYRFTGFTEVEIADFNQQQIESFAQKWFVAVAKNNQSEGLVKATQFIKKLNRPENQQVRELAVTPILLHLTCLVFQAKSKFPSNRAKLYEQGLDILLRKWDETRGIQRDEVYRALTLPHKKDLLAYLATITFEQGYYFFEDSQIKDLIADYLNTLPKSSRDVLLERLFPPEHLSPNLMDSEAVLQAIEAQHGLLVERARGIYSFSHLTFQEYFTARYFANRHQPQSLENLVAYITDKRWKYVFLLITEILPDADTILLLMKQQIDELLAADNKLQQVLIWANQKSICVDIPYKPAAVRAFYFALVHPLDPALVPTLVRTLDQSFVRALVPALVPKACGTVDGKDITVDGKGIVEVAVDGGLDYALIRVLNRTLDGARDSAFNYVFAVVVDPELKQALQELKEQLPNLDTDTELLKWWQLNGNTWREQLRYLMIKYRNIGHDWQLSQHQKEVLSQYYEANKLLVDCLNSSSNVTPAVREEIEDTLLLPIAEIKKRSRCIDNQI
jgi:predicted NACHT family NTPase